MSSLGYISFGMKTERPMISHGFSSHLCSRKRHNFVHYDYFYLSLCSSRQSENINWREDHNWIVFMTITLTKVHIPNVVERNSPILATCISKSIFRQENGFTNELKQFMVTYSRQRSLRGISMSRQMYEYPLQVPRSPALPATWSRDRQQTWSSTGPTDFNEDSGWIKPTRWKMRPVRGRMSS